MKIIFVVVTYLVRATNKLNELNELENLMYLAIGVKSSECGWEPIAFSETCEMAPQSAIKAHYNLL